MNRLAPKSWGRGFKAFIGIALVLVILFVLFGRSGDNSPNGDVGWGTRSAAAQGTYNKATGADYMVAEEAPGAPAATSVPMPSAAPAPSENYTADAGVAGTSKDKAAGVPVSEGEGMLPADRKIINEGSAQIETKDFDKSIYAMDQIIVQSGGFAESRYVQGNSINASSLRYATIVFRVPADKFRDVMDNMSAVGTVTKSNTNGTDITDQYIDSEARLKTLKVQEQTLLDIMAKAEKLEDVITLESRISDVQYQIESIQNQLKNYDRLIQYSRISVNINEVVEVTEAKPVPRTLGDKIAEAFNDAIQAFTDGLESLALWLVANWILFAFFFILIIVFIMIRLGYKKRKQKMIRNLPAEKADSQSPNDGNNH